MDISEAIKILNWLDANMNNLDDSDKMMIMAYYIKLGEMIKPFYEKYGGEMMGPTEGTC